MARDMENLSHRQRKATPLSLAEFLVQRVLLHNPHRRVAVLWTAPDSVYLKLWPHCETWSEYRDANRYEGPFPVICHPPCGPWGNYKARCYQSKQDGITAMSFVHRYGGVVEQPIGSSLFREYGRPEADI